MKSKIFLIILAVITFNLFIGSLLWNWLLPQTFFGALGFFSLWVLVCLLPILITISVVQKIMMQVVQKKMTNAFGGFAEEFAQQMNNRGQMTEDIQYEELPNNTQNHNN